MHKMQNTQQLQGGGGMATFLQELHTQQKLNVKAEVGCKFQYTNCRVCDIQHCHAVLCTELKINCTFLLQISSVSFRGKACIPLKPTSS
jgi:hypothetical protein